MFNRIGIVSSQTRRGVDEALAQTLDLLNRRNADVLVDERMASVVGDGEFALVDETSLASERDLLIAIGGDGTMLRAGKIALAHNVPLMGINLGQLGFLTDLSPTQIEDGLNAILDGTYDHDERSALNCEIVRNGHTVATSLGFNDVVIQKWNTARLISLDTYIDGRFVHSQRSDGMIIATPTGSTAYALSGGGPIVYPQLPAILLVPICPHSLTNRPIVIGDNAAIEVRISADASEPVSRETHLADSPVTDHSQVTCDGNLMPSIQSGDIVKVAKHAQSVTLIHPRGHDHFATLRAKLHWGRAPC